VKYRFSISRDAGAYLQRLDRPTQRRIAEAFGSLKADPYHPGTKALHDPLGRRAVRVGGWRIVYFVDRAELTVHVDAIGPRGQVYRGL
jgi:mRNA interferase RelE/StbE